MARAVPMNSELLRSLVILAVLIGLGYLFLRWRGANAPTWNGTVAGDFDFAAAAGTTGLASGPSILTRTYKGSLANATVAYNADAQMLLARGYRPVGQVYQPGSWGCGAFLLALILAIFLIGILIFIYLIVVKPDGTLVVTYQRDPAPA